MIANLNKIRKIVVNVGIGRMSQQPNFEDKILPEIIKELSLITGQKPAVRGAKRSIAGFKIRSGQIIGLQATLRGKRKNNFLEKLIKVILPRVRDFRGLNLKNIDKNGHLNIGLKDHLVFPEINPETSRVSFGVGINIVSDVKNRDQAIELYRTIKLPLKKK